MKNYIILDKDAVKINTLVILIGIAMSVIIQACNPKPTSTPSSTPLVTPSPTIDFGARHDSASYYFNQGWVNIMDYGLWDVSEQAFRTAITFDTHFLLGHALVGRISSNLEERTEIYTALKQSAKLPNTHFQLLLDLYLNSIERMNARETQEFISAETKQKMRQQSMDNMGAFIRHYPNAHYIKAEYIETIHANQNPQAALDSMQQLMTATEYTIPFFIGYQAVLHSELGDYTTALNYAENLAETVNPELAPAPHVVYAQIYFHMKQYNSAYASILKAVQLDPKHLIAQGLKSQIEEAM